jgi:hypothetical protein
MHPDVRTGLGQGGPPSHVRRASGVAPTAAISLHRSELALRAIADWVVERLAFPVIPPLVAAAGAAAVVVAQRLPPGRRSILAGGLLVIALAQMIYVVAKVGPWS